MGSQYLDVHCHIQFDSYDEDREALLTKMNEAGVGGLVVGCDLESSKSAVELVEKHEHLWAAVGLHPNDKRDEIFDINNYRELAKSDKVVAIGECGLDYFRPIDATPEVKAKQQSIFKQHIELAAELDKPLVIHSRPTKGTQDAYQDVISILKEEKGKQPNLKGDIHFFVGGVEEMREFIALGFTVSFTAVITFARDYDDVIRQAPLESILSETDYPFIAPASRRGQRNDPLAVIEVAAKLAEIREEDPEAVQAALLENAKRLFGLA